MGMNSVQEIEKAIDTLTPSEQAELLDWIEQRHQQVDAAIEADLVGGRFDEVIERALDDEKSGRLRPLPG